MPAPGTSSSRAATRWSSTSATSCRSGRTTVTRRRCIALSSRRMPSASARRFSSIRLTALGMHRSSRPSTPSIPRGIARSTGASFARGAPPATTPTTANITPSITTRVERRSSSMAFIDTISASWVTGEAFAMYDRQQKHYGYVPNYATVFSHRPEVMRRWGELLAALKRPMDKRRFELATFAAARELKSTLCTLAHGNALLAFFCTDDVIALARGEAPPTLSAVEGALMRFAAGVARDASAVTGDDI